MIRCHYCQYGRVEDRGEAVTCRFIRFIPRGEKKQNRRLYCLTCLVSELLIRIFYDNRKQSYRQATQSADPELCCDLYYLLAEDLSKTDRYRVNIDWGTAR